MSKSTFNRTRRARSPSLVATIAATLAIAGCGGGGSGYGGISAPAPLPIPAPAPAPTAQGFTGWSKTAVFPLAADGAPVVIDSLQFSFDGDEDPNAYSDLVPAA